MGVDLKLAVENLRNLTSSFSNTLTSVQGEKQKLELSNQLVASINANVDKVITLTETKKQSEDSNFLNQVSTFISNIFSPKKDNNSGSIHPMRFADVVDEILRNYGDAYSVNFDMTDMRNMGNINKGSMVENNNGSNSNINSNVDMNKMKDMPPSVNDSIPK